MISQFLVLPELIDHVANHLAYQEHLLTHSLLEVDLAVCLRDFPLIKKKRKKQASCVSRIKAQLAEQPTGWLVPRSRGGAGWISGWKDVRSTHRGRSSGWSIWSMAHPKIT
jgi:hypothetical protein